MLSRTGEKHLHRIPHDGQVMQHCSRLATHTTATSVLRFHSLGSAKKPPVGDQSPAGHAGKERQQQRTSRSVRRTNSCQQRPSCSHPYTHSALALLSGMKARSQCPRKRKQGTTTRGGGGSAVLGSLPRLRPSKRTFGHVQVASTTHGPATAAAATAPSGKSRPLLPALPPRGPELV